jgi:hypothetical protein
MSKMNRWYKTLYQLADEFGIDVWRKMSIWSLHQECLNRLDMKEPIKTVLLPDDFYEAIDEVNNNWRKK